MNESSQIEPSLIDDLERRLAAGRVDADAFRVRWNQISNVRLVIAVVAVGAGFWWIRSGAGIWGVLTLILVAAFVAVLIWHQRLRRTRDLLFAIVTIREQSIHRVRREWSSIPVPQSRSIPIDHPYANDLDLTGRGSLVQLVDTTQTPAGNSQLLAWLVDGASTPEILRRQAIASDLLSERDWREQLQAAGMIESSPSGDPEALIGWVENASQVGVSPRHMVGVLLAILTVAGIILSAIGAIQFAYVFPLFLINGLLSFAFPRQSQLNELNQHQRAMRQYRSVLPVAERLPGQHQFTLELRTSLEHDGQLASAALSRLDRTLSLIIPPSTIVWFPLQLAVNWDLLVDGLLKRNAREIGPHIRRWIGSIGEIEALSALAGLNDLNPDWSIPNLGESGTSLRASQLGHPLLPADRRVSNDIELGPPGEVLIVTGSNMAGKSTLLRSIGLNAVLARAGGPVCAQSLTVPNQPVWSSVRIQDSLEQGVSLYMAELLRLKQIVDAAQSEPVTYLLDEILHGTNTTERRIAARTVMHKLLRTKSIGAVSTHDLELIDAGLGAKSTVVHLVDQVTESPDGPGMTFDYKVRPGLAPSSNALRLLKLVGLGEDAGN